MHELSTNEDRVTRVADMANAMLTSGHFEADKIRKRLTEIQQLWAELNEVARARQEVRNHQMLFVSFCVDCGCLGALLLYCWL